MANKMTNSILQYTILHRKTRSDFKRSRRQHGPASQVVYRNNHRIIFSIKQYNIIILNFRIINNNTKTFDEKQF